MDRPTRACRICGRLIFWDHGFRKRNFDEHEVACAHESPDARTRARSRAEARAPRPRKRRRRKVKSQLELVFDDKGTPDES